MKNNKRANSTNSKPPLKLQTTTLWSYPSQHYGEGLQGDPNYEGATPSYIIWNLLKRYTRENQIVLDPFCGSGTTLDVAKDLGRKCIGFDVNPYREDIQFGNASSLPLKDRSVDLIFADPPYLDHIDYSDHPDCIGRLSGPAYYKAMEKVFKEMSRLIRMNGIVAIYVSDSFKKGKGFDPVGFTLFSMLSQYFTPLDIIAVTRFNKKLNQRNWHLSAIEGNYFLRGFNFLLLFKNIHK